MTSLRSCCVLVQLLATSVFLLTSCASVPPEPASIVTIERDGAPLARAYVRAVPVRTNTMPLPVTAEHLAEFERGETIALYADMQGRIELRRTLDLPYYLVVSPSPFDAEALSGTTWQFIVGPGSAVRPVRDVTRTPSAPVPDPATVSIRVD